MLRVPGYRPSVRQTGSILVNAMTQSEVPRRVKPERGRESRAGALCRSETESPLRSINEKLPVNRSRTDLLSREFLDDYHGAATARAKPSWGGLCLAVSRRLRGLLWSGLQQLLTEGQKLSPAPVSQEAGKPNPDKPAR